MEGLFDDELSAVINEQREDWALQGLSSFIHVLRRSEARSSVEARKLQTQLAAKAAVANMDMLVAELEEDARD
eukprot:8928420-Lingulodinium_polyedra.AAC.1